MVRVLCAMILLAVLVALPGCSYESRKTTVHKPGIYKGAKDPLLALKQEQALIDRFKLVQTDRN